MYFSIYNNHILRLYICASDNGITNITFDKSIIGDTYIENKNQPYIKQAINWLNCYFKADIDKQGSINCQLPTLDIKISETLNTIANIKFGQTAYYGELIKPSSARAVGNACRNNPILIIIPCHRIIAKSKKVSYSGGAEVKKQLLQFEADNI